MSKKMTENDYYKLAKKNKEAGNIPVAIKNYESAILLKPNSTKYLEELANIYYSINDFANAVIIYIKIVDLNPKNGVIVNQVGVCYFNLKEYIKAIEYFKKVNQIKDNIPDVYDNLGLSYIGVRNYKMAEKMFMKSDQLCRREKSLKNLADINFYVKNYDIAMNYYNETIKIDPNWTNLYNKGFCHLAQKQFLTGFELYENRLRNNNIHPHTKEKERVDIPMIPDWSGLDDDCEKLLIVYEQGIGDNIMFYRFAFELLELKPNMKLYYFCKENMRFLLKEYDNIKIITNSLEIMVATKKMYIMSFPFFLKIERIIPNQINYINVDDTKVELWRNKLSNYKRLKVGFVYAGLLSSVFEKNIPLECFESLTDLDIELICLSKLDDDKKSNYITKYNSKIHFFNIDEDAPFSDTIAILKNVDLLITVDTSIVHIAGVMGIRTWLLLGFVSEWRWSNDEKSYWYNSVDIIRVKEEKKELSSIMSIVKKKLNDEFLNNE